MSIHAITSKDGTRLVCERAGDGLPLVLVHGTGSSASRWSAVLPDLASRFTVYAMDRRGRGKSGDAPNYAIEREFEDVVALVESFDAPVYLLGHSYGGVCALEAARLTRRVRKLILYEPPIPVEGVPIVDARLIDRLDALLASGELEKIATTFMRDVVRMPAHELKMVQESSVWPQRVAIARTVPRELRQVNYGFKLERFKNLELPTLLMLGEDSPNVFRAAIEVLRSTLPNSRVAVLPHQQHIAMDTAPKLFVQEILSFLHGAV